MINKLTINHKHTRAVQAKDNYFIVHCESSTIGSIEVGWIDKDWDKSKFIRTTHAMYGDLMINKVVEYGNDYNSYIKAKDE